MAVAGAVNRSTNFRGSIIFRDLKCKQEVGILAVLPCPAARDDEVPAICLNSSGLPELEHLFRPQASPREVLEALIPISNSAPVGEFPYREMLEELNSEVGSYARATSRDYATVVLWCKDGEPRFSFALNGKPQRAEEETLREFILSWLWLVA